MSDIQQPSWIDQYLQETVVPLDTGSPEGEPVFFPPEDEPVTFTVEMTQTQFTAVLSSLIFGAGILYPDDYQNVVWYLMKSVTYQMSLCDQIIENCFTSEGFQQALAQLLGDLGFGAGGGGTNEFNSDIANGVIWSKVSCTDSEKFGLCFEMVAALNRASTDMLDELQDGTNEERTALDLAGNIPLLNVITSAIFDSASELASYVVDEIVLSYNSAYDEELQDDIACRIFQLMDGCELTLQTIIDGYEDFISDTLTLPSSTDMLDIIAWLAGLGSLIDSMVVATLHWAILQFYVHASAWFNNSARMFVIAASYAESVAPPEDCGGWCYDYLPANILDEWVAQVTSGTTLGTWTGTGWQTVYYNPPGSGNEFTLVDIRHDLPSANVTRIYFEFSVSFGTYWTESHKAAYIIVNGTTVATLTHAEIVSGGLTSFEFTGNWTATQIGVSITSGIAVNANPGGSALITRVVIEGEGTNPEGSDNC